MQFHYPLLISSIIIFTIQTSTASSYFFTPINYNGTTNWTITRHSYRSPPLIVQSGDSLIHVLDSDDTEHAIHLYSVDHGLCKVPLKLHYHQRYPRRAISLGNGKIVIWLLNYHLTRDTDRVGLHEAMWRFTIVEPSSCSSGPSILAIRDSEVNNKPVDVVDVVGYHDYFEVFVSPLVYTAENNIYGFRYYDNGVPIRNSAGVNSVIPDREPNSRYHPDSVKIYTVLNHDPSDGYYYLKIKPRSRLTLVQRFNSNFQSTRDLKLSKSSDDYERFDSYSVAHGNLTLCRSLNQRRQLHCTLLDPSLSVKLNLTMSYDEYIDYFRKIGRLSVINTVEGGALLIIAIEGNYRIGPPVYLQQIHADGLVSEPISIGRFFCEIRQVNSYEMPHGAFCVCVICDELVHTRCFRLNDFSVIGLVDDEDDDNDL